MTLPHPFLSRRCTSGLRSLLLLALLALPGFAQPARMPPPALSLRLDSLSPLLDTAVALLEIGLAEGWHVNSEKPADEYLIPTRVEFAGVGLTAGPVRYPAPVLRLLPAFGKEAPLYEGTFRISARVWKSAPGASWDSLQARLRYQACGGNMCLAPVSVTVHPANGQTAGADADQAMVAGDIKNHGAPGESRLPKPGTGRFDGPLPLVILLLLGLGFLLNLTPCVYPLLAVTIALFGRQGGKAAGGRMLAGGLYALGMVASFAALGVFSALSGRLFGAALQSAGAQIAIAAIFALLSLSAFGVYELRPPGFLLDRATQAGNLAGPLGALLAGLFAGLLASPCIGPFILALMVYVAEKGSLWTGLWMFSVAATGLAFPYFLLASVSGLLERLPRAGAWMGEVKKILGLVLLWLALYYLRGFTGEPGYRVLIGILFLAGAILLRPRWKRTGGGWRAMSARLLAALLLVAGLWHLLGGVRQLTAVENAGGTPLVWESYSDEGLRSAAAEKRPAIIDFESQAWCAACREMEAKTWPAREVIVRCEGMRLFRVDVDRHPQAPELEERFSIYGIPTLVVFGASGEVAGNLAGFLPPEKLILALDSLLR